MFELDTRQIATIIWLTAIVVYLIAHPKKRRAVAPALRNLFTTLLNWRIIIPIAVYLAYTAILIAIAAHLGLWRYELLVDTLVIILFTGLPMFVNASTQKSGMELIKKTLRETVGIAAFIAFYVGVAPLPLIGELILQPILGILVIFSAIAGLNSKHKAVQTFMNALLAGLGVWLIVRTTAIVSSWDIGATVSNLERFALATTLPLFLLPFVYAFALLMRYEIILRVSKNFNTSKVIPWWVYIAIALELNVQLGPLNNLGGMWLQKVVDAGSYQEARNTLQELKCAYRKQRLEYRRRLRRLRLMKGVPGVDSEGLQLDRREFYESKDDLESLLYIQMGHFRHRGHRYDTNLPIDAFVRKLPKDHMITMKVRSDKKAWYAWRRMPNGHYFGVGGSQNVDSVWLYDASSEPTSFPPERHESWRDKTTGEISEEWQHDDSPSILKIPR